MCRIAGILDKKLPFELIQQRVTAMCNLQQHGGPDGEGRYDNPENKLVLGHRRLALIELSELGHQPMHYAERYSITFNGEIYNFQELRKQLGAEGFVFTTHSDTEVILAAFARWHVQSFAKLQGMFALAIWDNLEKQLFLARDAAGIKPLYYSLEESALNFASEIRAFNYEGNSFKEDPNWPIYQLAFGHIPEPITTLQNVQPLPKGFFLQYCAESGLKSLQSFKFYNYSNEINNREQAIELVQNTFTKSVGAHLLADAPIGVFLSGGVDSSVITQIASTYKKENLHTLSLYFKEAVFSEKEFQDVLLKELNCKSYQHLLSKEEFENSFENILNAMDMPSCDGVNTWFISKYAQQQNLKAVLSGIGGDELFGGYPSFQRIEKAKILQKLPNVILNAGKKHSDKRLNRMAYLRLSGVKGLYLFLRGQYTPIQIAKQLNANESEIWSVLESAPVFPNLNNLDAKNQASWLETNMYMQNQLLRDADVMSMAHGIEIRVPFLDDQLIQTVFSIESSCKYAGAQPKQLLIDAFKQHLPQQIFNRKKMGFSFPFTQWLGESKFVEDLMVNARPTTTATYKKFKDGKMHWSNIMSLILLRIRNKA